MRFVALAAQRGFGNVGARAKRANRFGDQLIFHFQTGLGRNAKLHAAQLQTRLQLAQERGAGREITRLQTQFSAAAPALRLIVAPIYRVGLVVAGAHLDHRVILGLAHAFSQCTVELIGQLRRIGVLQLDKQLRSHQIICHFTLGAGR